jgi:hypothetical protein
MEFVIKEQTIRQIDNEPIAADAVNFPKAVFTFSDEWSAPIYAVFRNGRTAIIVPLESDGETYVCNVPHEVLTEGHIVVSCYNTITEDGELSKRLTTMQSQPIRVFRSGTLDGQAASEPTPTVFESYLEEAKTELTEIIDKAVPELMQEMQTEQAAREEGDTKLSDRIDTKADILELEEEQTARKEADTALSNEIAAKIAEARSVIPTRYIVNELPTDNINTNGIYLVPSAESDDDNIYIEYVYINEKWEIIGSPCKIDLSGYYDKESSDKLLSEKANVKNSSGGGEVGLRAVASYGFSGGKDSSTTYGGAAGSKAASTQGGAVGWSANATTGFAGGKNSKETAGGGAGGENANAAQGGGALGKGAYAYRGGGIGYGAATGDGFAGGYNARAHNGTKSIDAIQLGSGTNANEKTLQVYNYQMMDADGSIPSERVQWLVDMVAALTERVEALEKGEEYGENT